MNLQGFEYNFSSLKQKYERTKDGPLEFWDTISKEFPIVSKLALIVYVLLYSTCSIECRFFDATRD